MRGTSPAIRTSESGNGNRHARAGKRAIDEVAFTTVREDENPGYPACNCQTIDMPVGPLIGTQMAL
jgi:hypothetical protein